MKAYVYVGRDGSRNLSFIEPTDEVRAQYAQVVELAVAVAVAEPVAIYQWRTIGCADWHDGHPDHEDGNGPYETRTLYAAPPQREPAGFKPVPLEPTPEMAKAGCYRYCAQFVKDYKAMIAAAPKATP